MARPLMRSFLPFDVLAAAFLRRVAVERAVQRAGEPSIV